MIDRNIETLEDKFFRTQMWNRHRLAWNIPAKLA
jgi:hypothetical protein